MNPNHYLAVAIFYLFQHRPKWARDAAIGKTVVSSRMIDLMAAKLGRKLYEVPVGFKWFVDGLLDGSLGFGGEESAGASFSVSTALSGRLTRTGSSRPCLRRRSRRGWAATPARSIVSLPRVRRAVYDRVEAPATPEQKELLKNSRRDRLRRPFGRGEDRGHPHTGAGQQQAHRGDEGDCKKRMVRGAAVRD